MIFILGSFFLRRDRLRFLEVDGVIKGQEINEWDMVWLSFKQLFVGKGIVGVFSYESFFDGVEKEEGFFKGNGFCVEVGELERQSSLVVQIYYGLLRILLVFSLFQFFS